MTEYNEKKSNWMTYENLDFSGWNFDEIDKKTKHMPLPWDYRKTVTQYLTHDMRLLDLGTGGGEFLLSLKHPYELTHVTESYAPNYELCLKTLLPLGIDVKQSEHDILPFCDNTFDIVLSRHESFDSKEIMRVLKSGGIFITQQVGATNNNSLSYRLIDNFTPAFPQNTLENNITELKSSGFKILLADSSSLPWYIYDMGTLIHYAKIIEWEFPDFSVDNCYENLCNIENKLIIDGYIESNEDRFIIVAEKGVANG